MRHFRSSPSAIAALTRGMGKAAPACFLVAPSGLTLGLTAGSLRAALTAIDVAAVAVAADHHLAATTGTVEQTRAAQHRALLPMRAGLKPDPKRYSPVGRASHGLGARHRVDCGGQSRCRAFLNGPDDLTDSAQPVTSLRPAADLTPFGFSPSPVPRLHHPRWRFSTLFTENARVPETIHTRPKAPLPQGSAASVSPVDVLDIPLTQSFHHLSCTPRR
jgi:hypothetical protein